MKLVIDTNRIMAGLLKESTSRKIILNNHFLFYAPDYIETELFKHREYLMKKAKECVIIPTGNRKKIAG